MIMFAVSLLRAAAAEVRGGLDGSNHLPFPCNPYRRHHQVCQYSRRVKCGGVAISFPVFHPSFSKVNVRPVGGQVRRPSVKGVKGK